MTVEIIIAVGTFIVIPIVICLCFYWFINRM